jgi:HrpA-like RNA helicase
MLVFRGFMRIKCVFPPFSDYALAIAAAVPWFSFEERSNGFLSSCQLTAEALIELINREQLLERMQQRRDFDDDADDGSSHSSLDDEASTPSLHSPHHVNGSFASLGLLSLSAKDSAMHELSVAQKMERLSSILHKCSLADANVENISSDLHDAVGAIWPAHRIRRKRQCAHFRSAELGKVFMPCQHDLTCQYEHILGVCKNPKCSKEVHCNHLVHSFDFHAILRLDVKLESIFRSSACSSGAGLTLEALKKCLQVHRKQMFDDAAELLAKHSNRLAEMKTRLDSAVQTMEGSTLEHVVKNSKIIEAIQASCAELQKQIHEFSEARASFVNSNPHSFHEARLFAREVYNRFKTCLPIYAERSAIIRALSNDFSVLVLSAETGSGKSTQVVQYLSGTVSQRIICTQPRRLAAITLADRVAEEMMSLAPSDEHENLVECKEKKSHSKVGKYRPQIQFMTDFTLLNELYFNPRLPNVSAVVVDEVHERSVNTDILIALLRRTLQLRNSDGLNPFKLVLTSATMKHELFAKYFARNEWDCSSPHDYSMATVLKVGGRAFPVDIFYEEYCSSTQYVEQAEKKACFVHAEEPATDLVIRENHDILVFLTQPDEVDRLVANLSAKLHDALVVPLHGGLDRDEQKFAFAPADASKFKRKIVVCTNIAETSVTIDGIGAVIDCGFSKQARYDSSKDATVLTVDFISKSSAKQRTGRAGRTAPGKCFRLYSETDHDKMTQDQPAELLRADATQAILTVLRLIQNHTDWIADIRNFPFVEHPGVERLNRALKLLFHLGAIDNADSSVLTTNGKTIARMNAPPRVATCLLLANQLNILSLASAALGMVSVTGSLFRRSKDEQEVHKIQVIKKELCQQFPVLGDVGLGLAVFLQCQEVPAQELKKWCRERCINYFTLLDGIKLARTFTKEMFASSIRDESHATTAPRTDFSEAKDAGLSSAFILSHTRDLVSCIASGFFGNIAFYLPPRPDARDDLPSSYFLPANTQLAFTSKVSSFRASDLFPKICFYMEVVESTGVFISSLIGLPEEIDLPNILPDSYRKSNDFQHLLVQNARRQFLQRPAVVSSTCSVALKKMLGFKTEALKKIEEKCRRDFDIAADVEFILEPHLPKSMLFIMCLDEIKLHAVCAYLQTELNAIAERLTSRVREVAISDTCMRAVIGCGGECKELLLKPSQSISVRFSATNITHRLTAPITSLTQVPQGFFSDLVISCLCTDSPNVTDDEVLGGGIPSSQNFSAAEAMRRKTVDFQSMTVGQIVCTPHSIIFLSSSFFHSSIRYAQSNTLLVLFVMKSILSYDLATRQLGSFPLSLLLFF